MSTEKISISLDVDLVAFARDSAQEEGMSLSGWLAERIRERRRGRALDEALSAYESRAGAFSDEELAGIVEEARKRTHVTSKRRRK